MAPLFLSNSKSNRFSMLGVFMYVRNICTTMAMNTETSWIPSQWNRCWSILYANLLQWLDVGITLGNDTPTLLSNPTSRGTFFEPQGLCIEIQVQSMRKTNHLKWCWCDNIVLPNIVGFMQESTLFQVLDDHLQARFQSWIDVKENQL